MGQFYRRKFGLDFRIVDSDLLADLRRRRGIHVNPESSLRRTTQPLNPGSNYCFVLDILT